MWLSGAIESRHNCGNVEERDLEQQIACSANNVCKDNFDKQQRRKKPARGLDQDQQYKTKL